MIDLKVEQIKPCGDMVLVRKPRLSRSIIMAAAQLGGPGEEPPVEYGVIQAVGDGYVGNDGESFIPIRFKKGDVVGVTFTSGRPVPGCPGCYLVPTPAVVVKLEGVTHEKLEANPKKGIEPGEFILKHEPKPADKLAITA